MTCAQLDAFLVDYLDGTLPLRTRLAFRFHLLLCGQCRAYLAGYRQAVVLGRGAFADPERAASEEAPEDLIRAILASRPK